MSHGVKMYLPPSPPTGYFVLHGGQMFALINPFVSIKFPSIQSRPLLSYGLYHSLSLLGNSYRTENCTLAIVKA